MGIGGRQVRPVTWGVEINVYRACQRGFQLAFVAQAIQSAMFAQLVLVNRLHMCAGKPKRPGHFDNSLKVFR